MDKKAGTILKYALTSALAVILVWLAFRGLDWSAFLQGLRQTRWAYVVLFAVTAVAALVFRMLRWKALLNPIDPTAEPLLIWDADNIGNLANMVIPGSGEFLRCGYLSGKKAPYEKVLGTIALERVCDVLAVAVLLILALALNLGRFGSFFAERIWEPLKGRFSLGAWLVVAATIIVLGFSAWAIFHFRKRSAALDKAASVISGLGQGFASIAAMDRKWAFFAYTVGIWLMYILMCYSIILALPALSGLGFIDAVFISAVGNIASVIPVPGGIGAYHYLVALCLSSLYAAPWETGILYATLCHELHAVIIILLGVISCIAINLRKRK